MTGSRSRRSHDPAHGTITSFGTTHFNYLPDSGFSGTDTVTYTLRDSTTGATAEGSVVVRVDAGVAGDQTPNPGIDYFVVYQGSSVGFTVADLLANDRDPQGQLLTRGGGVGAGSNDGDAVGHLGGRVHVHAEWRARRSSTPDHELAYLVVDPDGHVDQRDDPDPDPGRRRHQPAAGGPGTMWR